jgi:biopolymer transport protein ExbD
MKPFNTINVIPFIDIMLVLLAIVLTTATFIAQGKLEIKLPQASSQEQLKEQERVELAIDQGEQIYFREQAVDLAALRTRLAALSKATPVVLRVDSRVPFGRFVAVVDLLKLERLERLSIITQEAQ